MSDAEISIPNDKWNVHKYLNNLIIVTSDSRIFREHTYYTELITSATSLSVPGFEI